MKKIGKYINKCFGARIIVFPMCKKAVLSLVAAFVLFSATGQHVDSGCVGTTMFYTLGNQQCVGTTVSLQSGPTVSITHIDAAQGQFQVTWSVPGTYVFSRTFNCGFGSSSSNTLTIHVYDPNDIPTPDVTKVTQTIAANCASINLEYTGSEDIKWSTGSTSKTISVPSNGQYYIQRRVATCTSSAAYFNVNQMVDGGVILGGGTRTQTFDGTLELRNYIGSIVRWKYSENNGPIQYLNSTSAFLPVNIVNDGDANISFRYWAEVQGPGGCMADSYVSTVTVVPDNTGPPPSYNDCVGSTTNVYLNHSIGCGDYYGSVEWNGADGGEIRNANSDQVEVEWENTGSFQLKRTFQRGDCHNGQLTVLYSKVYDIYAPPNPPLTPSVSINTCEPKTLTRGNPPAGVEWHWQGTNPDGYLINTDETYPANSSGTYYIRTLSDEGCWSESTPVPVTLAPAFDPGRVVFGSGTTNYMQGCEGLDANWPIREVDPASGLNFKYEWRRNGDEVLSTQREFTVSTIISGVYERYVRDDCNDWTKSEGYLQVAAFTLNPGAISASESVYCYGKDVTISGPPANFQGPSGYTLAYGWDIRNLSTSENVVLADEVDILLSIPYSKLSPGIYEATRSAALDGHCNISKESITTFEVLPPVPPGIITQANGCDVKILTHDGPGTIWWQPNNESLDEVETGPKDADAPGIYWYRVKNDVTGCFSHEAYSVEVTEMPDPLDATLDGGATFTGTADVALSLSSFDGDLVSYYYRENAGSPVLVSEGTKRSLLVNFTNNGTQPIEREYWAVISRESCEKESSHAFVTVLPLNLNPYHVNHIDSYSPRISSWDEVLDYTNPDHTQETTECFDGLGRSIQTLSRQGSPVRIDLATVPVYDDMGRTYRTKLTYPTGFSDGRYVPTGDANTQQSSWYQNNKASAYPYSEMRYEHAPISRVIKELPPGDAWVGSNRGVDMDYSLNSEADLVIDWDMLSGLPHAETGAAKHYPSDILREVATTDEDGTITVEYTDKQGNVVLKKSKVKEELGVVTWAETYYVYDDYNRLRVVLPPEASSRLDSEYFGQSTAVREAFLDRWAFQYAYDGRGRMTKKQVPGAEAVLMVYDQWDRLVLTQDGNQRDPSVGGGVQWLFTKYDRFNRPVSTGILTTTTPEATIRSDVAAYATRDESFTGTGVTQYSDNTYPNASHGTLEYLTVTYYDTYDFVAGSSLTGTSYGRPTAFEGANVDAFHLLPEQQLSVKGQVTGTKTKQLGTPDEYLTSVSYYDNKYRVIQVVTENHLNGTDVISNQYDFVGNVRRVHSTHNDGATTTTILLDYDYDHANRLLDGYHTLNGGERIHLYSNEYNELGELIQKHLHGMSPSGGSGEEYQQTLDYDYNIRGWLRTINESGLSGTPTAEPADLFSMELIYNTTVPNLPSN